MFADLHLHTHFSDGTYTPEQLAAEGKRFGLAAMSLTDHDTIEGCPRMAVACGQLGIEFIPGTELTAEIDGNELHLLGYYLDIHNAKLAEAMTKFQAVRVNRIREMVTRLNNAGVPLDPENVFAIANCHSPGRPHVARALVQSGVCTSMDEAFERFLKRGRPGFVSKFKISATDAIALIHSAGGAAVLAHPFLNRRDEQIPLLVDAGLDGLECFHSKHTPSATQHYLQLAKNFNLAITGGSDCHGMNKNKPLIGSVKIPYEYVELLKDRAIKRALANALLIAGART